MKKRELFDMMEEIDAELLERSEKGAEPRKVWMRWTALAACFCITAVIAVGVCVPFIRNLRAQSNPGETTAKQMYPPTEDPENDPDRLPSVPVLKGNDKVSEKTELSIGGENSSSNSGSAATVMPAFYIRTVVEAEVIEVLPDEYYSGSGYASSRYIARLKIKDTVAGRGLPEEIYLCYSYYGRDVFDGYDSFIFSLDQIGTENCAMINKQTHKVEYFPNMFDVHRIPDLGYGSVLAFNDGIVDEEFTYSLNAICKFDKESLFDDSEGNRYPARRGSTVEQIKENIKALVDDNSYDYKNIDTIYITPEKLFVSVEAMAIRDLTAPGSGNIFLQKLYFNLSVYTIVYERIVNGFLTNEKITLTAYYDGRTKIEHSGDEFTADDINSIPDIGEAIKSVEANIPTPPHIDTNGLSLYKLSVTGKYRKVDGKLWGVVRIRWTYKDAIGCMDDDMYYLYDSNGNGRIVERDELRAVIGDDHIILKFKYGIMHNVAF